jgi:hypothetical protein
VFGESDAGIVEVSFSVVGGCVAKDAEDGYEE